MYASVKRLRVYGAPDSRSQSSWQGGEGLLIGGEGEVAAFLNLLI